MNKLSSKRNELVPIAIIFFTIIVCEFIKNIYAIYAVGLFALTYTTRANKTYAPLSLVLFMLLPILFHHQTHDLLSEISKYEIYCITAIVLSKVSLKTCSDNSLLKIFAIIGSIHVFATIFFFLFRPAYFVYFASYAANIWDKMPINAQGGLYGYTSALNSHYSSNALFIVMELFALAALTLTEKKKTIWKILLILTALALMLTTKRGHLLFGMISILIVYTIIRRDEINGIVFKFFMLIIILIPSVYVLHGLFPDVFYFIERFTGEDDNGRLDLWNIALGLFENSPLTGIGWLRFSDIYSQNHWATYNVHNVYVQLLCETGIIGFSIFCYFIVDNLKRVLSILYSKRLMVSSYRGMILYCAFIQFFFVTYCFSGNCIYDNTLFFYLLSMGILLIFNKKSLLTVL